MIQMVKRVDFDALGAAGRLAKKIEASMASERPIGIVYQGLERLVCPHVLAVGKDGNLFFKGFQFGGSSSQGEIRKASEGGWRHFKLSLVQGLSELPKLADGWYPLVYEVLEKSSLSEDVISFFRPA